MKVAVIGGAGYIGSHVVHALLECGHTPVIVDDLSTGLEDRLAVGVKFECVDVTLWPELQDVFAWHQFDAVIHLAGLKSASESVEDPGSYWFENVHGLANVIQACRLHRINQFVFSSSAAVYGEPVNGEPLHELSPTSPTTPYGWTKLAGEKMLAEYLPNVTAFRYFNVAGSLAPHLRDTSQDNLFPRMRRLMQAGLAVPIFGADYDTPDRTAVRDYVHPVDVALAHVMAVESPAEGFRVLNLGSGIGFSVLDIVTEAHASFAFAPRRAGDPSRVVADISKARQQLGWEPDYSLEDIVESALWAK